MERKILYLEIDEEITSVIDRLKKTNETEVHLVVPKEAALLQSIVNLKLLKKQADSLDKDIQIITHDEVGRNLAEQVGIHSVSKMGDKTALPVKPKPEAEKEVQFKEDAVVEDTKEVVFKKGAVLSDKKEDELKGPKSEDKGAEKKKTKDLLPKFPKKKFIIIASVVGVLLLLFLYIYIPMTNIKLKVLSEKENMKTDLLVDDKADNIDSSSGTIPGNLISVDKTITKEYQATGTKNVGNKAQGIVTLKNNYSTSAQTIVAGTKLETGGLIFKTQSSVTVPGYTDPGGGKVPGTKDVSIIADSPGDNYNIGPSNFKISAFSGTSKYDTFTGSSSGSMTGGTTKEVKVVTASDISNARNSFGELAEKEIKEEGQNKMKDNETIDDKAQAIKVGALNISRNEGDEADNFTISADTTYKGLAYKKDDLTQMVYDSLKEKTGPGKQIMEDKLETVDITITNIDLDKGTISGEASATLHLGTKINEDQLKTEISGDKESKTKEYLENLDGIESVEVDYFPGFLKRTSRLKSHIYVKIEFAEKD